MNIEQIKNMKVNKKKSKNYNKKATTFTVHYNNIKLKYTAWFNIHLEKLINNGCMYNEILCFL